jgi:hypothetical protein
VKEFQELAAELNLTVKAAKSPEGLEERYLFSHDESYRYAFTRWWGRLSIENFWLWVMLNPAGNKPGTRRRPTLGRIVDRSMAHGAAGVITINLFALCTPEPDALKRAADPIGPVNDLVINYFTDRTAKTVAAWGSHGKINQRSTTVQPLLRSAVCLGKTSSGEPRHPLYVRRDVEPEPWP